MTGILGMSAAERERCFVIRCVVAAELSQRVGAERLGICVRQVKRLVRAFRAEGDKGLVSCQRGRVSPRRMEPGLRARIVALLGDKYAGFGATLAAANRVWHAPREAAESQARVPALRATAAVRRTDPDRRQSARLV